MPIPLLLAGLAAAAAREAQRRLDAVRASLENLDKEQQWWRDNRERLKATSCPPGQLWFHEKDPVVQFYRYDVRFPRVQALDAAPVPGAARYWGFCVPDPVAERLKDDQRVANSLASSQAARARTDLEKIDTRFSTLVASGQSPEQALAQLSAPDGIIGILQPYLARYAAEGFAVPLDVRSLIARNSDRIATLRAQMGNAPPAFSPVAPPPTIGSTATSLARSFNSQIVMATLLSSPFWIPVLALPALRKWRKGRGGSKRHSR